MTRQRASRISYNFISVLRRHLLRGFQQALRLLPRLTSKKLQSAFTIVELLIVVVVIAILAAIAIVSFTGIQQRARDSKRVSDVATITKALELYYIDNGQFPSGGGSTVMSSNWATTADASWQNLADDLKPYLSKLPTDPISTAGISITTASSNGYDYAYYTTPGTTYCGVGARKLYMLVYRLEGSSQTNSLIGDCTGTSVGPYTGASTTRVVKS
jgi:type II secretion system protein G